MPLTALHFSSFALFLLPWRWKGQVPPKRRFLINQHGATSQKTAFFIVTTAKTSNPSYSRTDNNLPIVSQTMKHLQVSRKFWTAGRYFSFILQHIVTFPSTFLLTATALHTILHIAAFGAARKVAQRSPRSTPVWGARSLSPSTGLTSSHYVLRPNRSKQVRTRIRGPKLPWRITANYSKDLAQVCGFVLMMEPPITSMMQRTTLLTSHPLQRASGYRRADSSWPVSFTVSAWEWVYATSLSRGRSTQCANTSDPITSTSDLLLRQKCHCACSPIWVWPLRNREPPAKICHPTYNLVRRLRTNCQDTSSTEACVNFNYENIISSNAFSAVSFFLVSIYIRKSNEPITPEQFSPLSFIKQ
jgi:hypothetical protein